MKVRSTMLFLGIGEFCLRCEHVRLFSGECDGSPVEYVAERDRWYCVGHAEAWREFSAAVEAGEDRRIRRAFARLV